jgi:transposase
METPACAGCRERDRLIADLRRRASQLEAQVERLTRLLEKAQRNGKRQAAPFAKGPPQHEPKRPGRKPGADYDPQGSSPAPRLHR